MLLVTTVSLGVVACGSIIFSQDPGGGPLTGGEADDPTLVPWTSGDLKVSSATALIRDGWYNMPNDLAMWKGFYWLVYRRGTGHSGMMRLWGDPPQPQGGNSFIVVWRSNDLARWHEVKLFEPPEGIVDGGGTGSGYLCPTDDRLQIFFRVQWPDRDAKVYTAWTSDGVNWTQPQVVRLAAEYPQLRHPRFRDGRFYCSVWLAGQDRGPYNLCVSDDGIQWERHAQIAQNVPEGLCDESDLHWLENGELWCVVRSSGAVRRHHAQGEALMFWSKPPYTRWEGGTSIGRCDAPVMCATGGQVYLAGRGPTKITLKPDEGGGRQGAPALYRLKRGQAELLVSFPAGGDGSYSGLISPAPGRLAWSFYSDVAYQSGRLKPRFQPQYRYKSTACDIYLAHIEVPV